MSDALQLSDIKELKPIEITENIVKLEKLEKEIKARLSELKERLLEEMKNTQVLTLKLESMTVSRATRKTVKVTDDTELAKELQKLGHEVITKTIIDMDYMKPVVQDALSKGTLNGAQLTETEYVTIRLAK